MSSLRKRGSDSPSEESEEPRLKPKPGSSKSRTLAGDARKVSGVAVGVGAELLKLVREMLVIPAQIWLAIAEVAGAAVLSAWRRIVLPGLGALLNTTALLVPSYLQAVLGMTVPLIETVMSAAPRAEPVNPKLRRAPKRLRLMF